MQLRGPSGSAGGGAERFHPCAAAVVWFTYTYTLWRSNPLAMSAIGGTVAAAVGMMAAAAFQLLRPRWKPGSRFRTVAIFAAGFLLSFGLNMAPISGVGAWRSRRAVVARMKSHRALSAVAQGDGDVF